MNRFTWFVDSQSNMHVIQLNHKYYILFKTLKYIFYPKFFLYFKCLLTSSEKKKLRSIRVIIFIKFTRYHKVIVIIDKIK